MCKITLDGETFARNTKMKFGSSVKIAKIAFVETVQLEHQDHNKISLDQSLESNKSEIETRLRTRSGKQLSFENPERFLRGKEAESKQQH